MKPLNLNCSAFVEQLFTCCFSKEINGVINVFAKHDSDSFLRVFRSLFQTIYLTNKNEFYSFSAKQIHKNTEVFFDTEYPLYKVDLNLHMVFVLVWRAYELNEIGVMFFIKTKTNY